jgi:hypothetical protein
MKTLLFFISLFAMTACSKNDDAPQDQLPPATTIGANTAGCLIDGKVLIPKNGISSISGSTSYGLNVVSGINFYNIPYGEDYFSIKFANLKDRGKSYWIYLHIDTFSDGAGDYVVGQSNGEFYLDASNNPQIIARQTEDNISGKTFLSSPNSGIITIKRLDFSSRVVSGIFECTLYNKDNPSETVIISEGRFDIKI